MGSLNSVVSLLPGLRGNDMERDDEVECQIKVKRYIYIMDSMTPK
jgi:signal recognition particle GTPase